MLLMAPRLNATRARRLVVFLFLCAAVRAACADTIFSARSFSTIQGPSAAVAFIGVTPFDPALGTLDGVNVTINGAISVSGTTMPFLAGPAPTPYQYEVSVTQDFFGLGGKYFDFDSNALLTLAGMATGSGEPFTLGTSFSYGFSFTSTTDIIGFTFPSFFTSVGTLVPPTSISGTRADFQRTLFPLDEIDLVETWSTQAFGPPPPLVSVISTSGALIIQYNYTPAQTGSVSEPGSAALLGLALAGLGFGRRRRAR